jgi:hypothetical protein
MKETLLDKIYDKLINVGFGIFIITAYSIYGTVIVGGIIGFWYGVYYIIKSFFNL